MICAIYSELAAVRVQQTETQSALERVTQVSVCLYLSAPNGPCVFSPIFPLTLSL
jgi:hypothetical protein